MASVERTDAQGNPIPTGHKIGTGRLQDEIRREEEAARREALQGHIAENEGGPTEHEAMAAFREAEAAVYEELGATESAPSGASKVDHALVDIVAEAGKRVEAANMSPEVKLAKALAKELRGQVISAGPDGTEDIYLDEPATPEETLGHA